jgi:hypothetical protein
MRITEDNGSNAHVVNSVVWDVTGGDGITVGPNAGSCSVDRVTVGQISGTAVSGITATNSLINPNSISNLLNNPGGAVILKRYGKDGSKYGEPGAITLSDVDLWPFPNEDAIKSVFAEQMNTPSGYKPANNISARGFATGSSLDGTPQTLTKYIWEYLGNPIPDDIYGNEDNPPSPPTNLRVVN